MNSIPKTENLVSEMTYYVVLCRVGRDSVPVCDGRTDRQTDIATVANTVLCIASYADAL